MKYVKELRKYSEDELRNSIFIDTKMLKSLLSQRIMHTDNKGKYYFKFVGVILHNEKVIFSLPKYINLTNKDIVVKQILKLFKEYSTRENLDVEELETIGDIESNNTYNSLATIIYILSDYIEYGLYNNQKTIYTMNGQQQIDWIKTIDEISPIVNNNEPIYLDYYTYSTQDDEENYFKKLHKYVLTLCSEKLINLGLEEFLDITPVLFNENVQELGGNEIILSKISKELNKQFVSRKQLLLKAMAAFISNEKMWVNDISISFYGTRSFHTIWEKTCSYVLNNRYQELRQYIAHPEWITLSGKVYETETLIPDIISISKDSFVIFDAKYYTIVLSDNKKLTGNPGVEDISKQYIYLLAFEDYICEKNFKDVRNILLFPTEEKEMYKIGEVKLKFFEKLGLANIEIYKVPTYIIFERYINSKSVDLDKFLDCKLEDSRKA